MVHSDPNPNLNLKRPDSAAVSKPGGCLAIGFTLLAILTIGIALSTIYIGFAIVFIGFLVVLLLQYLFFAPLLSSQHRRNSVQHADRTANADVTTTSSISQAEPAALPFIFGSACITAILPWVGGGIATVFGLPWRGLSAQGNVACMSALFFVGAVMGWWIHRRRFGR